MSELQPDQPPADGTTPKRMFIVLGVAVALIAAVAVVIWSNTRFEYDEAAHQRVVEAYGVNVADWPQYRDAVMESCEFDEDAFELYVLMQDDLGLLQLDIKYACPDRMDEFTDITGMAPLD